MNDDDPNNRKRRNIAFVWDALGPQHIDRVNSLNGAFGTVHGVQVYPKSWNYGWTWEPDAKFERHVILKKPAGYVQRIFAIASWCLGARFRHKIGVWFLCNYEEPYTFLSAILLRLTGAKVFIVQDSKFDDYQRNLPLEVVKWILYRPYMGAIVSGERTRSYLRFLGVKGPIRYGYNTANVARLEAYRQEPGPAFADRPFLYVGRLIPKKNLPMLVTAYAEYVRRAPGRPRALQIVGGGPEEERIRALVEELGLSALVSFHTWTDQPVVLKAMAEALYLFLPSITEQFGNVIGEACSVDLPVIVSTNVGARDQLVDEFRNGFSIPAAATASWAQAMLDVSENEGLWRRLREGARANARTFDVANFLDSVRNLVDGVDLDEAEKVELIESLEGRKLVARQKAAEVHKTTAQGPQPGQSSVKG